MFFWTMNHKSLAIVFVAGTFLTTRLLSQNALPEPSVNSIGSATPTAPAAPLQIAPALDSSVISMPPAPAEKPPKPKPRTSIEIDLQTQRAYLLRDGKK